MRLKLINFRGLLLTEDTSRALVALEQKLADVGKWRVLLVGPTPGSEEDPEMSLIPAGRELHLSLEREGKPSQQAVLNALWGCAIPLGFTPWIRHPVPGVDDIVFHFMGPWRPLVDRLLSEGRGHLAWPSACAAAQTDVGQWKGDKAVERFVQGQLHRIGRNCGPVDGVIGPRTSAAIESLGVVRASLADVKDHLMGMQDKMPAQAERRTGGSVTLPGQQFSLAVTGGIKAVRGKSGATLTIDGPGRLVIDVGVNP